MTEQKPTIHLTQAEYEKYIADACAAGARNALDAVAQLVEGLRERVRGDEV